MHHFRDFDLPKILACMFVIPWIVIAIYNKLRIIPIHHGRERLLVLNPGFRSMLDARRSTGRPVGHLLIVD